MYKEALFYKQSCGRPVLCLHFLPRWTTSLVSRLNSFSVGSMEDFEGTQSMSTSVSKGKAQFLSVLWWRCVVGSVPSLGSVEGSQWCHSPTQGLPPDWRAQAQGQQCEMPHAPSERCARCLWRLWGRQNMKTCTCHVTFRAGSAGIQQTEPVFLQWFITYVVYIQEGPWLFR